MAGRGGAVAAVTLDVGGGVLEYRLPELPLITAVSPLLLFRRCRAVAVALFAPGRGMLPNIADDLGARGDLVREEPDVDGRGRPDAPPTLPRAPYLCSAWPTRVVSFLRLRFALPPSPPMTPPSKPTRLSPRKAGVSSPTGVCCHQTEVGLPSPNEVGDIGGLVENAVTGDGGEEAREPARERDADVSVLDAQELLLLSDEALPRLWAAAGPSVMLFLLDSSSLSKASCNGNRVRRERPLT